VKIEYTLKVEALCPVDHKGDIYDCTLRSDKPIAVERILKCVRQYSEAELFQEELADTLARQLFCTVELVGYHSGVKVKVVA
jgi:hypothetical protein